MQLTPEEYLFSILSPLSEKPEEIKIEKIIDERGVLLTVMVDRVDMPRTVGREGATALAIRNLLRVYGSRYKMHLSLRIDEPKTV